MKYFCAKCQKKHEVTDIGVDMRYICLDDIIQNINPIMDEYVEQESELGSLRHELIEYLNDEERSSEGFRFRGFEIQNRIVNIQRQGTVLTGDFTLNLGWLLDAYERSPLSSHASKTLAAWRPLLSDVLWKSIYQGKLSFAFQPVPGAIMFDHVLSASGDPFTDDAGVKRGFHRICPHCGMPLSRAVGRAEEIVIALSGAPRAGKTSCLTAITSALQSMKYDGFGMQELANDPQWESLSEEIGNYDKGYKVTKTPTNIKTAPAFSILSKVRGKERVLTFVDMPGEFWDSDKGLDKEFYEKYIGLYTSIDCIWLFISKLTVYLAPILKTLNAGDPLPEWIEQHLRDCSEDRKIIEQAISNFPKNLSALSGHMKTQGHPMPPVAVIITKPETDFGDGKEMWDRKMFPADLDVSEMAQREMDGVGFKRLKSQKSIPPDYLTLNEQNFFGRAQDVRRFLQSQSSTMLQSIEDNFDRKTYISMAAYGHPAVDPLRATPAELNDLAPPTPYHEFFPLLWTLSIMGALPVKHYFTYEKHNIWGTPKVRYGFESRLFHYQRPMVPQKNAEEERKVLSTIAGILFMLSNEYISTKVKDRE